jgi:hypothetical protein
MTSKKQKNNYKKNGVNTMTERFIIDDCGTLIDIQTRNTYDYVTDVCPLLNQLVKENKQIRNIITEQYQTERTQIGKNTLKQLIEAIQ